MPNKSMINFQSIFENLPCYVYLRDVNNHIIGGNKKTMQLAGVREADDLKYLSDFDAPWCEYADNYLKHDKDTLSGINYRQLDPVMSADGFKVLMAEKTVLYDEEGNFSAILGVGMEVKDKDILTFIHKSTKQQPLHKKKSLVVADEKYLQIKFNKPTLSLRESECLFFLLHGYTTKMIANLLGLSSRTIETYIENIKNKFGCNSKSELIELSIELGIFHFIPENIIQAKMNKFFQ
ncbi:MAG: helix-turn-helix transcriptional regulator [Taibaiella sp.]